MGELVGFELGDVDGEVVGEGLGDVDGGEVGDVEGCKEGSCKFVQCNCIEGGFAIVWDHWYTKFVMGHEDARDVPQTSAPSFRGRCENTF